MKDHHAYFRRVGCEDTVSGKPVAWWPDPPSAVDVGKPDIRGLIGEDAWWRLRPAVRERFAVSPARGERWRFKGIMETVECTGLGRVMAWASRFIGAPVAHRTGRNVPIDVFVYMEDSGGGTVWERAYHFGRAGQVTARTTKRIDHARRMLECFGLGFGMELDVYEHDGALHFRSTAFYVGMAGWRLRLPYLFSPGTLLVEHIDEGDGEFRFRMTVNHEIYGCVFFQNGTFRKIEES